MNKIFIINRVFHDPDDGCNHTTPIGYTVTEDLAKQKIDNLNKLHKEVESLNEKIEEHVTQVIIPCLEPFQHEDYPQYPKWRTGIHQDEITTESDILKKEQQGFFVKVRDIHKLQREVSQRNCEKERIRSEKINSLRQEYIDSLHINSDVLKVMKAEQGYEDNIGIHYVYKEIEEL